MRSLATPLILITALCITAHLNAADAIKPIARRIPPKGTDIGDANRAKIQKRLDEVTSAFKDLRTRPIASKNQTLLIKQLSADVDVYIKAVRFALMHGEFYAKGYGDVDKALRLLDTAEKRMDALAKSQHKWTTQRGKLVRGYYSNIDGSPQPYGLEIPEKLDLKKKVPLYVWLHGRGDKTTDMHFIAQREKGGCQISPFVDDGIIAHPFGRHCVGYKGPGEIDVLDVIASVKKRYNIDEDRVALLGFSMGGAGAWHIGAHYADQFCVVHAGAGFAETKEYIKLKKEDYPAWYTQKLWGLYDVPNYTRNLFNTTVIAYSGEKDKQIQAARVMERAFKKEGRTLQHIIGPGMGHKYHPESIKEVMKVVKAAVKKGRDRWPKEVHLQTRTLRYGNMHWVNVSGLESHWNDTRVHAKRVTSTRIEVTVENVKDLFLSPHEEAEAVREVVLNGKLIYIPALKSDHSFIKQGNSWKYLSSSTHVFGRKNSRNGPIDEIVMSPFIVVPPTTKSKHPRVQRWIDFELNHFVNRWRALYRGEPRVKKMSELTADEKLYCNLIRFGDPTSHPGILKVFENSGIKWTEDSIHVGARTFDSKTHIPLLLYPHSESSKISIFQIMSINAGITHREAHDRTNSLQNPKLPDWAIISLEKDPDAESPGVVKAAGFFDENWKVKAKEPGVNER